MSEQIESQVISRRKLFLLVGLAASFAVPAAVLTASNAEAQQPEAQQPSEAPKKKKEESGSDRFSTSTRPIGKTEGTISQGSWSAAAQTAPPLPAAPGPSTRPDLELDRRCFIVLDANGQALAYVYCEGGARASLGGASPHPR